MKEYTKEKLNKFCDIGLIILTCFALLFCGFCVGCKVKEQAMTKDNEITLKTEKKLVRDTNFVSTRIDLNYKRNFLRSDVWDLERAMEHEYIDISEYNYVASDFNLDYFFKADYINNDSIVYEGLPITEFGIRYYGNYEYMFRYVYQDGEENIPLFSYQNGDVIEQTTLGLSRFKYIYDFNDFNIIDIDVIADNFKLKMSYVEFLKIFFYEQNIDNVYFSDGFNPINYLTTSERDNGYLDNRNNLYDVVDINKNKNKIFTDGLFRVGNTFYHNITLTCASGTGYYSYIDKSYVKLDFNIIVPIYVSFDNTIVLNISNKTILDSNSNQVGINEFNVYHWVNVAFRDIQVYSYGNARNNLLIGYFTNKDTLDITYNSTQHYIDGNGLNVGTAFGVIGSAFNVFTPFFSMQIVPGLTIGLMLSIPLIVLIIMVVFRIVRK